MTSIRRGLYDLLDQSGPGGNATRVRAAQIFFGLVGILAVAQATSPALSFNATLSAEAIAALVGALFAAEYALRLWTAPEIPHLRTASDSTARFRWALSPRGLIGLAAAVPILASARAGIRLAPGVAAVFVLVFVLKLASQAPGLDLIVRVVRKERPVLTTVAILFLIVLLAAAALAHLIEGEAQPDTFGSMPMSLWWAMVTLTTTGYGDMVPHTAAGRILAGGVMFSGFAVLALLSGILATGFSDEVKRTEFVRIWDLVARVPFFSKLGAATISDIVARLRSRNYPAGSVVIRRGSPGDCMYFLVTGEVEVQVSPSPVRLGSGSFFGEMALLNRAPRTADVLTTKPCTMLLLDVADFYQVAAREPGLLAAIEAEGRRRMAENKDGGGSGT